MSGYLEAFGSKSEAMGMRAPQRQPLQPLNLWYSRKTESKPEELGSSQEEIRKYQENVKDLEVRPDPVTFAQLQAMYEGL